MNGLSLIVEISAAQHMGSQPGPLWEHRGCMGTLEDWDDGVAAARSESRATSISDTTGLLLVCPDGRQRTLRVTWRKAISQGSLGTTQRIGSGLPFGTRINKHGTSLIPEPSVHP
jgi:hypothetical protein